MKLIQPSYQIINQEPGIEGIYKNIELASRNCYKSEPVEGITSKDFVDRMIKRGHLSTLEHGTVCLKVPVEYPDEWDFPSNKSQILYNLTNSPYCKSYTSDNEDFWYISTNYRVILEHNAEFLLEYLCEPTEHHEKRVTVKFTSSIHFYKDTTRHRKMSYAIESTRFCNYLKEKFGVSISFIEPIWIKEEDMHELEEDCKTIESIYFKWINKGYQAQHAAYFLIQGTKADIIMTGFVSDWNWIFQLRTSIIAKTGQPHPELARLIDPLYNEFKEKGLI